MGFAAVVVAFSLLFAGIIALVAYGLVRGHLRWRKHSTLEQYLAEHPACKTDTGVRCTNCGAMSIKNWGLASPSDSRRLFICNHCGQTLYRSV